MKEPDQYQEIGKLLRTVFSLAQGIPPGDASPESESAASTTGHLDLLNPSKGVWEGSRERTKQNSGPVARSTGSATRVTRHGRCLSHVRRTDSPEMF